MPEDPEPTEEELEERLRKLLAESELAGDPELEELEIKLRDVESKLDGSKEERSKSEALFDDEFEGRLQKLHERADVAKTRQQTQQRERARSMQGDRESAKGLGMGLTVAYTIVGLPLAGAGVGWLIDRATGGHSALGISVVVGAVLGMVMAMIMLSRANQER